MEELFSLPGVDASHVYVRALALGCFYSHISTRTFRRALTASLDSCAEIKIECPFSGGAISGRVWRKVPESGARSVRSDRPFTERWTWSVRMPGSALPADSTARAWRSKRVKWTLLLTQRFPRPLLCAAIVSYVTWPLSLGRDCRCCNISCRKVVLDC